MPLYEYVCSECRQKFEELRPIGSDSAECPQCGLKARRVLSMFAAISASDDGMMAPGGFGGCGGCGPNGCGCGH